MGAVAEQLDRVGIKAEITVHPPESSTLLNRQESAFVVGGLNYSDSAPYSPWPYSFGAGMKNSSWSMNFVWTDIYDPELYAAMCDSYEAMMGSVTWEDMVANSKSITDMLQRSYGGLPGVQMPIFTAVSQRLKGVVIVTENHVLLWHYLYL